MFAGMIMGNEIFLSWGKNIDLKDLGFAVICFILLQLIRYLCIGIFYPCLSRMGFGMTPKEYTLIGYAGLRGAVGLSLALMVKGNAKI
jgi:NhaP-type Na+/H+ or K+/H+ antiporter